MPSALAGVSAGGSVLSGLLGAGASESAAKGQVKAAKIAAQAQLQMFDEQQKNLAPFTAFGEGGMGALQTLTGTNAGGDPNTAQLTKNALTPSPTWAPTMAQLESTPGYQFTLQQGLKSTQNSYAAQGLGISGAAMKGAADYASGLASTTYQQQFSNFATEFNQNLQGNAQTLAQNQQIYNMLSGQIGVGLSAATQTANMGMQAQTTANNYMTSGAAAGAAGTVGAANSIIGGINGATSALGNYQMMNMLKGMYQTT